MAREFLNAILILLGILSAGLGLKGFLLPSGFIDGGVTGVSLLLAMVTSLPLAFWLPVINAPFVFLGYRHLGAPFAIRSALAIGALAIVLALVHYPTVTQDRLLDAVFGGFFLGAGIGLAVRGGAVLDGTEIAALLISKRSTLLRVGDVILGFNVFLFLVAMAVLGVESALYSILTYLTAARTLDFVIHGIEEYTAMTIVSGEERGDPRRHHRHPRPRRDGVSRPRRTHERGAGHPLLCRDAPRDWQDQVHCAQHRRKRVHRVARAVGRRRRGRQEASR